ncbi:MAG: tRNA(5-methylaminomethyl-2-thiouridylate) methyltransferase [Desulfovibrionaceae bacterium]|nr:tRNA(5-methylaminomethyl-2-thiouridylate) methyltransferase [Desulfovibrionaceae bacterium]
MSIDGVVLFSGGLDSLLAARLLAEQGLKVLCLHYVSPFFGSPHSQSRWKRLYGLDVEIADAGREMVRLINDWPEHGFGKVMNPCVDCKITLMRLARLRMEELGGSFVATGEVLGQRPMSQRRDVMNLIMHEAGVDGLLLRPLCARHLEPTPCELSGQVDRSRLLDMHGRGRQGQLALAQQYGFSEIPSPGGGCRLTERENARHYWPLRMHRANASVEDYVLTGLGRQLWRIEGGEAAWMVVARNNRDNERLRQFQRERDLLAGLCDHPGPLALLRDGRDWSTGMLQAAAAQFVSYAPKAAPLAEVRVWLKDQSGSQNILSVKPDLERTAFSRPTWEEVHAEKHALASRREAERLAERQARREARFRERQARLAAGTAAPDDAPASCADGDGSCRGTDGMERTGV